MSNAYRFHKGLGMLAPHTERNASKMLLNEKGAMRHQLISPNYQAPLLLERCNYNAMIEFVTISKLKGILFRPVQKIDNCTNASISLTLRINFYHGITNFSSPPKPSLIILINVESLISDASCSILEI